MFARESGIFTTAIPTDNACAREKARGNRKRVKRHRRAWRYFTYSGEINARLLINRASRYFSDSSIGGASVLFSNIFEYRIRDKRLSR